MYLYKIDEMWEYNRFEFKYQLIKELITKLNKLGEEDWDIVYYNETKPPKFGDDWIAVILTKRKNQHGKEKSSDHI